MKLHLLAILGIVFLAGCVSDTSKSPNNGVAINEFSVDPQTAEFGDTVRFFMDGENVGGTTAECVTTELFGLEGGWVNLDGSPFRPYFGAQTIGVGGAVIGFRGFGIDIHKTDGKWGGSLIYTDQSVTGGKTIAVAFEGGDFSVGGSFFDIRTAVDNSFRQFVSNYCNYIGNAYSGEIKFEPILSPPLAERNKPGQSFTADWIVKPPLIPEGLKVDYPVTARTSFFYTSNAQVNIPAFSKAEYKRRQDIGEQTQFPLDIVNTHAAPIQVSISRGASPIVVNTDVLPGLGDTGFETFNYLIEIQNIGQGYPLPFTNTESTKGLGPDVESGFMIATMSIAGPGARFEDCLGQSGQQIVIGPDVVQNLVKLRSDNSAPFGCKILIDKAAWQSTPAGTISITFNILYRYYVDSHATVTVIGPSRS